MSTSKILIVDDESSIRIMLARMIEPLQHEVYSAEDGVVALEVLRRGEIDLVISDLNMPRMNGLELLAQVRRDGLDCAFIILTAFGDLPQALAARELYNISNFLVKPIHNMDQFLFDVESALSRRLLERENRQLLERLRDSNHQLEAKVRERTRELEAKNRELGRLSRFRADVLKVLGHELRTPLAILSGYHALAIGAGATHQGALAPAMGASIQRLQQIVDKGLLLLKANETMEFPLELQELRPRVLCCTVIDRLQPFVAQRRLELLPPPPCESEKICRWDAEKVGEIVEELLINAIRASADGSRIEMDVQPDGDSVEISVKDYGVGIPAEQRERIFEPFVTLQEAVNHSSGMFEHGVAGVGIGLSTARMWAALHGGTITAEANPRHPGTLMRVRLLRDASAARPASVAPSADADGAPREPRALG